VTRNNLPMLSRSKSLYSRKQPMTILNKFITSGIK
jgi:hypothetical protein